MGNQLSSSGYHSKKYEYMLNILHSKFHPNSKNSGLNKKLMKTGKKYIIEHQTPANNEWGESYGRDHRITSDKSFADGGNPAYYKYDDFIRNKPADLGHIPEEQGGGVNGLGICLMVIRDYFANYKTNPSKSWENVVVDENWLTKQAKRFEKERQAAYPSSASSSSAPSSSASSSTEPSSTESSSSAPSSQFQQIKK